MPRVVHVVRSSWPAIGGLEASVDGLARAQHRLGWSVQVAAIGATSERRAGVRYRPLRRIGPRRYPFARGLGTCLREADVVHVHGIDGLADQAVRRHARVGVSTHGGYFHTPRHRWAKELLLRTWTRRTLQRAGAVWFTSEADRERLGAAGVQGEVIGDGVDLDELTGSAWAPVPGRWVVPGRVDVHKGLDDLVHWLAALGPRGPAEVRVVGPWTRPELVPSLRRAGLTVVGPVPREVLLSELRAAERVVLPSRFEGFGIAALEVMALGIPMWLSDIPAHRALDIPDDAGRVDFRDLAAVDRWDPEAPVRLVAARQAASRAHGWQAVARRFVAAYEAL